MARPYKQPTTDTPFGHWLHHAREHRGWTMLQLAARAATVVSAISNLERGERNPSREMVLRLADALGVDPDPALLAAGFAPTENTMGAAAGGIITANELYAASVAPPSQARARAVAAYNNAPPEIRRAYDELERAQLRLLDPFIEKSRRESNAAKRADRLRAQTAQFDTLTTEPKPTPK